MLVYLLLAVAVQIVIALFVGGYANGKERDGALWFLIGLILGPVAFLPLYFFDLPPVRTPFVPR